MSDDSENEQQLVEYLKQRGHSQADIEKIVKRLADHDQEMFRQSVFDSIESGSFNLEAIIKEALDE